MPKGGTSRRPLVSNPPASLPLSLWTMRLPWFILILHQRCRRLRLTPRGDGVPPTCKVCGLAIDVVSVEPYKLGVDVFCNVSCNLTMGCQTNFAQLQARIYGNSNGMRGWTGQPTVEATLKQPPGHLTRSAGAQRHRSCATVATGATSTLSDRSLSLPGPNWGAAKDRT